MFQGICKAMNRPTSFCCAVYKARLDDNSLVNILKVREKPWPLTPSRVTSKNEIFKQLDQVKSEIKILQALTFVTSHVFTWGTNKKPSTTSAVSHVNDSSVTGFYGIKPRSPSQWNVKRTSQSFTRMLRETFRWRKSFDCGFRNNGDLCPDMAPFGQIIGLRQVISEELQNKNDDQLSGKSVFEEFLFYIGFLLLLILSEVRCQWSSENYILRSV